MWYDDKDLEREAEQSEMFRPATQKEIEEGRKRDEMKMAPFDHLPKDEKGRPMISGYSIGYCGGYYLDHDPRKFVWRKIQKFVEHPGERFEVTPEIKSLIEKAKAEEAEYIKLSEEYQGLIDHLVNQIKNSKYRLIKIGTGINKRTGNPNFQVYLDRNSLKKDAKPWYGDWSSTYTKESLFINLKVIEAKNLKEAEKEVNNEFSQSKFELVGLASDPSTSRHTYEISGWIQKIFDSKEMKRAIELQPIVCRRI